MTYSNVMPKLCSSILLQVASLCDGSNEISTNKLYCYEKYQMVYSNNTYEKKSKIPSFTNIGNYLLFEWQNRHQTTFPMTFIGNYQLSNDNLRKLPNPTTSMGNHTYLSNDKYMKLPTYPVTSISVCTVHLPKN